MLALWLCKKNILMHIEVFRGKIMCLKLGFKIFQKKMWECGKTLNVFKAQWSQVYGDASCILLYKILEIFTIKCIYLHK